MMAKAQVIVSPEPFNAAAEQEKFSAKVASGALASFCGRVRPEERGARITALHIEHYPGMTERCLAKIAAQASEKWPLAAALIMHRIGRVAIAEPIVLVVCASDHRQDAFNACFFIVDYLKTRVPLWKRACRPSGDEWIRARRQDELETERW